MPLEVSLLVPPDVRDGRNLFTVVFCTAGPDELGVTPDKTIRIMYLRYYGVTHTGGLWPHAMVRTQWWKLQLLMLDGHETSVLHGRYWRRCATVYSPYEVELLLKCCRRYRKQKIQLISLTNMMPAGAETFTMPLPRFLAFWLIVLQGLPFKDGSQYSPHNFGKPLMRSEELMMDILVTTHVNS